MQCKLSIRDRNKGKDLDHKMSTPIVILNECLPMISLRSTIRSPKKQWSSSPTL